MKVYYCSVKSHRFPGFLDFLSAQSVRHPEIIIDCPERGLMKISIQFEKAPSVRIKLKEKHITEFRRETESTHGAWSYEVGKTNLHYEEIIAFAREWVNKHPQYQPPLPTEHGTLKHLIQYAKSNSLIALASQQIEKYQWLERNNCRSFTNELLKKLIIFGKRHTHISEYGFKNDPCTEIEARIQAEGFNTPSCIHAKRKSPNPVVMARM